MAKPKTPDAPRRSWLSKLGLGARAWKSENLPAAGEITVADTLLYGAGSTTVSSLLTSGARAARTRQEIYDKWSRMESDPLIAAGVKLLCTAALGGHETTGDIVYIEKLPVADEDAKLGGLVDELKGDLLPTLNQIAYPLAYLGAVYGDAYARVYTDHRGIRDLYLDELVRPPLVQPFERGSKTLGYAVSIGDTNFQRLDAAQMVRLKMPRTQWVPQHGLVEKSLRVHLQEDAAERLPLLPAAAGGSLIYPAEDAYDNLTAALLGLVGQRWLDSIDEQMLAVNLQDMSKDHQTRFLASITDMLTRSKSIAEAAVRGNRPVLERIRHIVPVFGEKQLTTVSAANGGQPGRSGSITIDDVMLHARLLAGALGVDLSMIGFADQMSGGLGEGGFFRTSAQAAESARVIRGSLERALNQIIDIHTLRRYGLVFEPHARPWRVTFYGSLSALESERQKTLQDGMTAGLTLVQALQGLKELGVPAPVMETFLRDTMQLDEEQAKLYSTIANLQAPEPEGFGP